MCNEVVTWILFPEHIYMTEAQYNLLEKLREGHYNYRSLQPVVRQTVFQPPSDFFMEPQIVTSLKNALISVVNFFTNVTRYY
ncbi:hypothetical protein RR48_00634 [Papilio machaon]|uniref:Alpha-carbonic anhydrase domain-containing protein n=1 Tax=Papilio machaon TaxID=76193 RepID=A0A0N1IQY0_PAPMA|nr:hypothetical protein RR48_00634 [Papilio machaon]